MCVCATLIHISLTNPQYQDVLSSVIPVSHVQFATRLYLKLELLLFFAALNSFDRLWLAGQRRPSDNGQVWATSRVLLGVRFHWASGRRTI
jgi:hypothetical protein